MNTSKTEGYKIAQRMHCDYNTRKTATLEISDVVPVGIFHNGGNIEQMPACQHET
jgi:hypothetical protein